MVNASDVRARRFKVAYVTRFRADLPRETAGDLWTHEHAPLAAPLTDLQKYVQSHVVGAIGLVGIRHDLAVGFDGYSCEWWKDRAAFDAGMQTPAWKAIVDDGEKIFDMPSMDGMCASVQERIMRDGPTSPFKVVWFARFKAGMDIAEAARHWRDVHAPIALRAPGIDRYVQNLVVGSIGADGVTDERVGFDGFSECWYADQDAYERASASDAWAELNEDGQNFLDMDALEGMSAVVAERVITSGQEHGIG